MSSHKNSERDADRLIRRAMSGKVPPDVEGRMRERMLDFRTRLDTFERETRTSQSSFLCDRSARTRTVWHRLAFAGAVAGIMCVSVVQLSGMPSPLARVIDALQNPSAAVRALRTVKSLECRIDAEGSNGEVGEVLLRWQAPGRTRIDFRSYERSLNGETWWIENGSISVIDSKGTDRMTIEEALNRGGPRLKRVMEFATPESLSDLLNNILVYAEGGRHVQDAFRYRIRNREDLPPIAIVIDPDSLLPVSIQIEREGSTGQTAGGDMNWTFRYEWDVPIESRYMKPNRTAQQVR